MKCDLCKKTIQTTVLEKLNGTYLGRAKKRKAVCNDCQRQGHEQLVKKLKI